MKTVVATLLIIRVTNRICHEYWCGPGPRRSGVDNLEPFEQLEIPNQSKATPLFVNLRQKNQN